MIWITEWIQYYLQFFQQNNFLEIIFNYITIIIDNFNDNNFFLHNNTTNNSDFWSKFEKWHHSEDFIKKSYLDIVFEETMEKVKARNKFLTVDEFLRHQHYLINSQNYNDLIRLFDYIDPISKQNHNKLIQILSTPKCNILVDEQLFIFKKMYIYNYKGEFFVESLYQDETWKTVILGLLILTFIGVCKILTG